MYSVCVKEELHDIDSVVYRIGSSVDSVYYVSRGRVSVAHKTEDNNLKIVKTLTKGDIWGAKYFEGESWITIDILNCGRAIL